jgi:sigma-B regulation protein RsbU (phosphoserine phosphatase)
MHAQPERDNRTDRTDDLGTQASVTGGADGDRSQPSVREIMARAPAVVSPGTPVMEAAALMSRRKIGSVVVSQGEEVVGILTERDLLRAAALGLSPDRVTVAELMTPSPVTVPADATWTAAAELMVRQGVRHLPVTERGRLTGMVSQRDLMEHSNRHLEWLVRQRTAELREKNAALEERDRLIRFHLDVAARLQRQLLPAGPPELPAFTFALAYHPLDHVSGDYYDFAMLSSGRLGVLVADASGHSVPAAFVSVMAKTAFHAYAQGIESPAAVLRTMNHRLADLMGAEHFITMFYGVVERETLRLVYALAGHPRPLWYRRATGAVEALDADGPVIGLWPDAGFEERAVQLAPGDLVLVYTDGVTECRDSEGEPFGRRRLEAFLAAHGGCPDAVPRLDAELERFRGGEPFHDDVTCIGLGVRG